MKEVKFLNKISKMQKITVNAAQSDGKMEPFIILFYPSEISIPEIFNCLASNKVLDEDRILMIPERIFEHFFGI